jgi:hypothetical protein
VSTSATTIESACPVGPADGTGRSRRRQRAGCHGPDARSGLRCGGNLRLVPPSKGRHSLFSVSWAVGSLVSPVASLARLPVSRRKRLPLGYECELRHGKLSEKPSPSYCSGALLTPRPSLHAGLLQGFSFRQLTGAKGTSPPVQGRKSPQEAFTSRGRRKSATPVTTSRARDAHRKRPRRQGPPAPDIVPRREPIGKPRPTTSTLPAGQHCQGSSPPRRNKISLFYLLWP